MTYDMSADYKRCGHKIQQAFGITAEEFQAARKIGRKKKLGDILEWIKDRRERIETTPARPQAPVATPPTNIPGITYRGPVVLVPVPTEKLSEVLSVLGH